LSIDVLPGMIGIGYRDGVGDSEGILKQQIIKQSNDNDLHCDMHIYITNSYKKTK
jgi:hypothetical protein